MWYVATLNTGTGHVPGWSVRATMQRSSPPTGLRPNCLNAVEITQNPVNFAACLSIIYRIQSIFVKYSQRRLYRRAPEMCA